MSEIALSHIGETPHEKARDLLRAPLVIGGEP